MSETTDKAVRLSKVAREFNLGLHTVVEFLEKSGHTVESNPNTKIDGSLYDLLLAEFGTDKAIKEQSQQTVQTRQERETITLTTTTKEAPKRKKADPPPVEAPAEPEVIRAKAKKTAGPKTVGKIDLDKPRTTRGTKVKKEEVVEPPAAAVKPVPRRKIDRPQDPREDRAARGQGAQTIGPLSGERPA